MSDDIHKTRKGFEDALNNFEANKELNEMSIKRIAELYYFRFKSFQEAGFTEKQAFELIVRRGLE